VQAKLIVRPAIAFYSPDQGAEVRFCYNRPFLDTSRRAHVKAFAELTEREILAVAVFAEEEDSRIYLSFAEDLAKRYPESARGGICGLMTALGGLGHSIPYLVPDSWPNAFWIATGIAGVVVFFELWAIAYIRAHYMDTPFLQAVFQIVLGGSIVLAVGILIGAA